MSSSTLTTLDDYDAIAAAVMETERGRWFLAEFAQRNRAADTAAVLTALSALEERLAARPALAAPSPASPNPPADAERLIGLINAAIDRAARIRAELSTAPAGEHIDHALRDCAELDSSLARALAQLGARLHEPSPARSPAPLSPVEVIPNEIVEPKISALGPDQDFGWIDIADFEADIVRPESGVPALADEDSSRVSFGPGDGLDGYIRGRAADETEASEPSRLSGSHAASFEAFASAEPAVTEPAIPRTAPRPRLPLAWTPGLLDRLTPEERAILFA